MEPTSQQLEILKTIELDLLRCFIDVCNRLKLKYYLIGGTLLGAVRHQGFIPWDDDIDVGMPRDDYEILLSKGQELLPNNYFLQSIHSEENYFMCFAKLRNSDTTFIESGVSHIKMNHGVFIDIFPLDYYPKIPKEQNRIELQNKIFKTRILDSLSNNVKRSPMQALKFSSKIFISKLIYPSMKIMLEKREKLYRSVEKSSMIANYGGAWGKREIVPFDWYGEGVQLVFEGIKAMAPVEYDKWLTQVYGDYMTLPPIEKRITHHYTDVVDLENSYNKYI